MNREVERSNDYLIIFTTTDREKVANEIATQLIEEKVAACVQVDGPLKSYYRWEGRVESGTEYRLMIKTSVLREREVYQVIHGIHNYDLPQIVSLPLSGGFDSYLRWIDAETNLNPS